jgi:hypothetical protein
LRVQLTLAAAVAAGLEMGRVEQTALMAALELYVFVAFLLLQLQQPQAHPQ